MTNEGLKLIDNLLGTTTAKDFEAKQKAQNPQPLPQPDLPPQQTSYVQMEMTEKQKLKEQLEVLKLQEQIKKKGVQPVVAIANTIPQLVQQQPTPQIPIPQPPIPPQPTPQPTIINAPNIDLNKVQQGEVFDHRVHCFKKQSAFEVLKETKKIKNMGIISIVGVFVVAITSALSIYGGSAVAGIYCMGLAYVLFKNMQRTQYLEDAYDLGKTK